MTDIRSRFPQLSATMNGQPIVYLDSAATAQRPDTVLRAVEGFYQTKNANPHRGVYALAMDATDAYEAARQTVADFIGASAAEEVVFTRNATESLNLVAYAWGYSHLKPGDRVVITIMEHHSNLIPWQQVCRATGAELVYLYCDAQGRIPDEEIEQKINAATKIVSITHVSNVLGVMTPYRKIIDRAKSFGATCVMDCAQSVPHMQVNVQELSADFVAFSGHKLYAPYGIGVLWGKADKLNEMPPFLTGGEMIDAVTEQEATWAEIPQKFEAGTQNAGGAIGLAEAIRWMQSVGMETIENTESKLHAYALAKLRAMDEIILIADGDQPRYGVISFNIKDVHPHDVASVLDADGVCIRAGHHCAQPLLKHLGISSCCRASLAVYNTTDDIDRLCESLKKVRKWLGYGA